MEDLCMESIWKQYLKQQNWPEKAIAAYKFTLAQSTRQTYDKAIKKCDKFCQKKNIDFPPSQSADLAEYMCEIASETNRPKSALCINVSALSNVYYHTHMKNMTKEEPISKLLTALIKSGTSNPMTKSTVLPITDITNMFKKWGENKTLSIKLLRLKAITLLALSLMLRPSDIAPKGVLFDQMSQTEEKFIFSRDMIQFVPSGMYVTFLGIKNDYDRAGFKVFLPSMSDKIIDPVTTLSDYMTITDKLRTDNAVFVALKKPYKAISAASVANVLEESLAFAGLANKGFSAKSFRPTGATKAIENGVAPDVVQKLGRWKCTEVFKNHYVHSMTPADYATKLLQSQEQS